MVGGSVVTIWREMEVSNILWEKAELRLRGGAIVRGFAWVVWVML